MKYHIQSLRSPQICKDNKENKFKKKKCESNKDQQNQKLVRSNNKNEGTNIKKEKEVITTNLEIKKDRLQ